MARSWLLTTVLLITMILVISCSGTQSTGTQAMETKSEKAVIQDRTGRLWDVTHARNVYDMNSDYFNFGLGIGAIPSIDYPTILNEGDPGYPTPESSIQVFGVSHNGEHRAYDVRTLNQHEVINDTYPGEVNRYLAVTF